MRSVVVVLPASMWALMPMLRYRSIGVLRATVRTLKAFDCHAAGTPGNYLAGPVSSGSELSRKFRLYASEFLALWRLETVVRERLVRFRHAVHFIALFHRAATALSRLHQFV